MKSVTNSGNPPPLTRKKNIDYPFLVGVAVCVAFAVAASVQIFYYDAFQLFDRETSHERRQRLVLEHDYALAQKAIGEKLLAPSTAVFCPIEEVKIEENVLIPNAGGFRHHEWSGWVDAQNAYGVPVRHYWTAGTLFSSSWSHERGEVAPLASFKVTRLDEP